MQELKEAERRQGLAGEGRSLSNDRGGAHCPSDSEKAKCLAWPANGCRGKQGGLGLEPSSPKPGGPWVL